MGKKERREDAMAAITKKDSVFVVKTTKDSRDNVNKELNEARISRDFLKSCVKVSKELRKK